MTSDVNLARGAGPETRQESKFRSYLRLGKLDVFDYYIGILVVSAAVLLPVAAVAPGTVPMLLLFLAGEVCTIVAMVALDDVTGYRDGSDIENYGPNNPLRKKLRKPLVAGTLTEAEAMRFAWITACAGALLWAGAIAVAPYRPMWTVVLIAATYVISLQYSYGMKLSYHGFQEAFLVALGVALVFGPYGLATGEFSGFLLVQAVLFGMGPLMFGVYSNTNDVEGDRAVGRPTVAALTSPRGNAIFIGALSAGEFVLVAAASLTGVAPAWFVLLMLPATILRARQYYLGFGRGDIMRARKLGFTVHRTYVALLVLANLLIGTGILA
ncbi:1,4-dihydroxy-2-naphthoate octaprenyltransferase [Saccharopolyspora antimicrobica]|uniref:1,4-dihydroxy-2-naphthoate octaprenyltransferase n=1 Tax=Saccharopolyspora antimicrobica TaxID=455193 RepID=A0A1I4S038_9PSEU|nr:UbiA family prenyltransferase [Saccharopolyspora antimicrobica]RKT89218.1 1,4-dihydroxy-2-naphthoate octaprenyltransferase [Saccharopolyspora antimicrobica]SFM57835.1 1,4-dihydroxy-2-naphthoate octaprenyltransferase [Saccharopolyspora antimicrobica]